MTAHGQTRIHWPPSVPQVEAHSGTSPRSIYAKGIEPVDCGLRNILWERETKKCSIIDFELWRETDADAGFGDETKELQRWGLVRQPTAKNHYEAWNLMFR